MKIYITDTSPYARIVRIVILEKGLENRVEFVLAKTRTPGSPYYKINPSGRVPYLVRDDGAVLENSDVICRYLDELDGERLFDVGTGEAAWEQCRLAASAGSMLEGLSVWFREVHRPAGENSPTILAHETDRSQRMLGLWEEQIQHPLMHGKLNMAQIVLIAGLDLDLQIPDFNWRSDYPKLSDWANHIGTRPSIIATLHPGK